MNPTSTNAIVLYAALAIFQNTTKTNTKYDKNKYRMQQKQIQNTTKQIQNTTTLLMRLSYAERAIFQKPSLEDDSKLLPSDDVVQVVN